MDLFALHLQQGILHPLDARCAIDAGAAAIAGSQVEDSKMHRQLEVAVIFEVVSNHGGRQLDSTPATIDVLPAIAAEVKGEVCFFLGGRVNQ